eukprot:jgi/Mesen1/3617/ME000020S03149
MDGWMDGWMDASAGGRRRQCGQVSHDLQPSLVDLFAEEGEEEEGGPGPPPEEADFFRGIQKLNDAFDDFERLLLLPPSPAAPAPAAPAAAPEECSLTASWLLDAPSGNEFRAYFFLQNLLGNLQSSLQITPQSTQGGGGGATWHAAGGPAVQHTPGQDNTTPDEARAARAAATCMLMTDSSPDGALPSSGPFPFPSASEQKPWEEEAARCSQLALGPVGMTAGEEGTAGRHPPSFTGAVGAGGAIADAAGTGGSFPPHSTGTTGRGASGSGSRRKRPAREVDATAAAAPCRHLSSSPASTSSDGTSSQTGPPPPPPLGSERSRVARVGSAQAGWQATAAAESAAAAAARAAGARSNVNPMHLLMAVAQAVVAGDAAAAERELSQLHDVASVYGDASQRVCAYFLEGLLARTSGGAARLQLGPEQQRQRQQQLQALDYQPPDCSRHLVQAFQALMVASPYLTFGQVSANCALLEAFAGSRKLHIVDFGIGHGLQWPPLMQEEEDDDEDNGNCGDCGEEDECGGFFGADLFAEEGEEEEGGPGPPPEEADFFRGIQKLNDAFDDFERLLLLPPSPAAPAPAAPAAAPEECSLTASWLLDAPSGNEFRAYFFLQNLLGNLQSSLQITPQSTQGGGGGATWHAAGGPAVQHTPGQDNTTPDEARAARAAATCMLMTDSSPDGALPSSGPFPFPSASEQKPWEEEAARCSQLALGPVGMTAGEEGTAGRHPPSFTGAVGAGGAIADAAGTGGSFPPHSTGTTGRGASGSGSRRKRPAREVDATAAAAPCRHLSSSPASTSSDGTSSQTGPPPPPPLGSERSRVARVGSAQAGWQATAAAESAAAAAARAAGARSNVNPMHLLMAVAQAVVAGDAAAAERELSQLHDVASVYGDASQRVCAYFLEGLLARTSGGAARLQLGPEQQRQRQQQLQALDYQPPDCSRHLVQAFQVVHPPSPPPLPPLS